MMCWCQPAEKVTLVSTLPIIVLLFLVSPVGCSSEMPKRARLCVSLYSSGFLVDTCNLFVLPFACPALREPFTFVINLSTALSQ